MHPKKTENFIEDHFFLLVCFRDKYRFGGCKCLHRAFLKRPIWVYNSKSAFTITNIPALNVIFE